MKQTVQRDASSDSPSPATWELSAPASMPETRQATPPTEEHAAQSLAKGPESRRLAGPTKAVIWLLSIERGLSVSVLSKLEPHEVRTLHQAASELDRVTPELLGAVHAEFRRYLETPPLFVRGNADYFESLTADAFSGDAAVEMLDPYADESTKTVVSGLNNADVDALMPLLLRQHPQVMAAVLASLPGGRSAELLQRAPQDVRLEVIGRIARLKRIPQEALRRVSVLLKKDIRSIVTSEHEINGVKTAADVLNALRPEDAQGILEALAEQQDATAHSIRDAMFIFDDLKHLDREALQSLLRNVADGQLLLALKTASSSLKRAVFGAMSKRAAESLREELATAAPARVSAVEDAQRAILDLAQKLRSKGEIHFGDSAEELV